MTLKKFLSAAATTVLMGAMFAPSVLASELEISGNGSDSTNKIELTNVCVSGVKQSDKTVANTWVSASSSTGGNTAKDNTGGSTTVDTGDATTKVNVVVTGGDNTADVPSCCDCQGSDPSAAITGNGADSYNKVEVTDVKVTFASQKTKTYANTGVSATSKTGWNKAKDNTGGPVEVKTGKAKTRVDVLVSGGSNTLNP